MQIGSSFCLRIVCTWVTVHCVYLSHCVLCISESLCNVCTWVTVYCVYLSHCALCVPDSLCIVCTWVTVHCVYLSHCVLCVPESLYILEDKNRSTNDVQNNQSFYSQTQFSTHFEISQLMIQSNIIKLKKKKNNTLHFRRWLKEANDTCS
jgi:hypothetical protein